MQELLLHLFIVAPVVQWIFRQPMWPKVQKIAAAVGFLALLAAFSVGSEYMGSKPNLYQITGIRVDTPQADLRRHFRTVAAKLHPDKNPSPTAEQEFIVFREASEFLANAAYRGNYDRFGAAAIKLSEKPDSGANDLIVGAAVSALMFYSIWAFLTFLMLSGKDTARGRTWVYVFFALIFLNITAYILQLGK